MSLQDLSAYVKTHERLIIALAALIFAVFAYSKTLGLIENYEQGKLTKLQQQLEETKQQAAAAAQAANDAKAQMQVTAAQANNDRAASAALISSLTRENATLANQIIQRATQTQAQQRQDMAATIPELSQRFAALVPEADPRDVKISADQQSVNVGQDTARKTIAQLELVPALQADKTDLQRQVQNGDQMLASSQKALASVNALSEAQSRVITAQEKYSGLLQTQLTGSDKVCEEKLAIERTKTKKAFLRGFKWGAITGFVGGILTGHLSIAKP